MKSALLFIAALLPLFLNPSAVIAATPLVNHGDSWHYRLGTNAAQADWQTAADAGLDGSWLTGPGGIGYGDGDDATDIRAAMSNKCTTVYIRRAFAIASVVDTNLHLSLTMDYDDGFVAYLDGTELARGSTTNGVGTPILFNATANSHEASAGSGGNAPTTFDLGAVLGRLPVGTHVLAIHGINQTINSSDLSLIADLSLVTNTPAATNCVSGTIAANTTWYASNSPIVICGNVVINSGVTVTIEPGVTVQLVSGVGINVNGRLLAEGNASNHIHFTKQPAGGNWRSLDFLNTTVESRLAYIDFDSCGGSTVGGHNAQLHVNGGSIIFIDHCTWPSTPVIEYISFDGSSFIVQNCVFPTYSGTSGPESLHGVNGIPLTGYGIFRDNYFGHTYGFNDTIDFTGGNRPGAILQIINNVFDGASDDHLDLDSTDAWIEGNVFMHAHRDPTRTDNALDTASAISGGVDVVGQNSDWTIINNIFYDVDHVFLNKGNSTSNPNGGGRVAFLYNTVAHVAKEYSGSTAAEICIFNWSDDDITPPAPAIGSGLYAAHNIFVDAPVLQRFYFPTSHTVIFDNNIFPPSFSGTSNQWAGAGSGNRYIDPMLNLAAIAGTNPTNVTAAQLRQAFQLLPGSPALGAGFGGRNLGGLNSNGIAIAGEPASPTTNTSATLTVGVGGTFNWGASAAQRWGYMAYKWKLDTNAWSAEIPVNNNSPFTSLPTISLTGLSEGPHTVYVVGKNDVGFYQDDPFVYPATAGIPASVTASRTWTVTSSTTFRIDRISIAGTNSALIEFAAQANTGYTILYRDSLSTGSWQPLVHVDPIPMPHPVAYTDTLPPGTVTRFYQVSTP